MLQLNDINLPSERAKLVASRLLNTNLRMFIWRGGEITPIVTITEKSGELVLNFLPVRHRASCTIFPVIWASLGDYIRSGFTHLLTAPVDVTQTLAVCVARKSPLSMTIERSVEQ